MSRTISWLSLPSGLWRIALVLGVPVMGHVSLHLQEKLQIVMLSVVAELAALTCLALVRPWGERVPGWVPGLRGQSIHPMIVVVPAMLGSATLTVLWTVAIGRAPFGGFFDYFPSLWTKVLVSVCYLPLLAWGPLLAALTLSYHRRRAGEVRRRHGLTAVSGALSREVAPSPSIGRRDQ